MNNERSKYFFKFYSFGEHIIECLSHLRKGEVYASDVTCLNDPFENHWEQLPGLQFEAINRKFKKRIDEKRGVYCMCSSDNIHFPLTPESFLMWAHYADSNRGFCIVFSSDILKTECQVANCDNSIYYRDDVPGRVTESYGPNADKELHRILHQKPKCWEYEKETRLVFEYFNKYYKIPKGCIIGIYCGVNISEENKALLRETAISINIPFVTLGIDQEQYKFVGQDCMKW